MVFEGHNWREPRALACVKKVLMVYSAGHRTEKHQFLNLRKIIKGFQNSNVSFQNVYYANSILLQAGARSSRGT